MSNKTDAIIRDQINRALPALRDGKIGDVLYDMLAERNYRMVAKAGLVIKAGASAVVKAASAIVALVAGSLVYVAPSDMAALVGTLATAKFAAWAFYVDGAGALTASAKTADSATAAAAVALLPAVPSNKTQIGFIVVQNATGSNFVGGTTALDTASLTVTYVDTIGAPAGVTVPSAR